MALPCARVEIITYVDSMDSFGGRFLPVSHPSPALSPKSPVESHSKRGERCFPFHAALQTDADAFFAGNGVSLKHFQTSWPRDAPCKEGVLSCTVCGQVQVHVGTTNSLIHLQETSKYLDGLRPARPGFCTTTY